MRAFLLFCVAWLAAHAFVGERSAFANDLSADIVLHPGFEEVRAGKSLELYLDETAALDVSEVARLFEQGRGVRSRVDSPGFGFSDAVLWGKLVINDQRDVPSPLVIQLAYAPIDRLEVYSAEALESPMMVLGDTLPFSERSYAHRFPNVRLEARAGRAVYYLRASGSSSLMLPVRVASVQTYIDAAVTDQAAQMLYVGIMLALIAYNLFLFFGVGEKGYLFYSIFISLFLIYQSSMTGITFQYLWPNNAWLPQRMMSIAVVTAAISGSLFVSHFLGTKEAARRSHRALAAFAILSFAYFPFAVFGPARYAFPTTAGLALGFSFLVLVVAALRLRRGGRPARVFLLAWGFFLVGNILASLRLTGVAPGNFWTENAQQVGSALEGLLLSFGLADRIRELTQRAERTQRERALEREKAAGELQILNDELRRQIIERSREVASLLQEISRGNLAELTVGSLFDGRYQVSRLLAKGGMGSVYEVERQTDRRRFALKVLTGGHSPTLAARFAREAEIAASLRHPHLVEIVDFGISQGRTMFLVMELVDGPSLEAERARFGQVRWALPLLAQTALGLGSLHQRGVVHRDLKPSNVLLQRDKQGREQVKIGDFGLSRVDDSLATIEQHSQEVGQPTLVSQGGSDLRASPRVLTVTGTFLGTPHYMAPELALGAQAVHAPADVFSFGVMAFEMLTSRAPFPAPPLYDRLAGRSLESPPELKSLCRALDGELARLLQATLLEDPGLRPSMDQLARALSIS